MEKMIIPVPITAKVALLQSLLSGPGYGQELAERVRERSSKHIILLQGSLYPALRGMERDGLLETYEEPGGPERAGRPRVYYKLTKAGKKLAQRQLALFLNLSGAKIVEEAAS